MDVAIACNNKVNGGYYGLKHQVFGYFGHFGIFYFSCTNGRLECC